MPIILNEPQLTVVWAVQPVKIKLLFNNKKFTDGGLMPRFLALDTYCDATIRTTNTPITPEVREGYESLIKTLLEVLHSDESEKVIQLSDEVISVFTDSTTMTLLSCAKAGESWRTFIRMQLGGKRMR